MISLIKTGTITLSIILLLSCSSNTSENPSESKVSSKSEKDKLFGVFEQWKKQVLNDSTYLLNCPSVEDFETLGESVRAEKLSQAHIFPENYKVAFGDYNGDKKEDALFSFPDYICYSSYIGRTPPNGYNRSGSYVLVTSTFDSYKNSSSEIDIEKIEIALQNKFMASRVSVSLDQIDGENILSGTCKIWLDRENINFLGDCCPSYLLSITVNNGQREISTYINEDEREAFDIRF